MRVTENPEEKRKGENVREHDQEEKRGREREGKLKRWGECCTTLQDDRFQD